MVLLDTLISSFRKLAPVSWAQAYQAGEKASRACSKAPEAADVVFSGGLDPEILLTWE